MTLLNNIRKIFQSLMIVFIIVSLSLHFKKFARRNTFSSETQDARKHKIVNDILMKDKSSSVTDYQTNLLLSLYSSNKNKHLTNQDISSNHKFVINRPEGVGIEAFGNLAKITLFVRTALVKKELLTEVFCELFRTTTIYWSPKFGPLQIVLDEESEKDHQLSKEILKYKKQLNIDVSFRFEPLPSDMRFVASKKRPTGYNRQLYSSFFIDQYVDTDVVAWIDTDCRFTSPVTPNRIIHNGKLRVKGMNTFKNYWLSDWDKATQIMIGYPLISDFMTSFPMFIWKDTITNCRNHILKYMNVSTIVEATWISDQEIKTTTISPINTIMNYAYYFEYDRYDWHIDIGKDSLADYNNKHAHPKQLLTPEDITPEIHLTVHGWRYKGNFLLTYCAAINSTHLQDIPKSKSLCENYRNKIPMTLFEFCNGPVVQSHLDTWCRPQTISKCHKLINNHFSDVQKLINSGVHDLNLQRVNKIETIASKMGAQCKPLF